MEVSAQELAKQYAAMEDEPLLKLATSRLTLTEDAEQVLIDEVTRRGLEIPEAQPLPVEAEFDFDHWVTIDRFRDLSSGIVARSALEASEIECYLRDENTVRLDWQISNFIGGMRLQVREQDAEAASAILSGLALSDLEDLPEDADSPDQERCPRCGSTEIHRKPTFGFLSLLSVLWLSIPAPQGRRRWTCDACANQWVDTGS